MKRIASSDFAPGIRVVRMFLRFKLNHLMVINRPERRFECPKLASITLDDWRMSRWIAVLGEESSKNLRFNLHRADCDAKKSSSLWSLRDCRVWNSNFPSLLELLWDSPFELRLRFSVWGSSFEILLWRFPIWEILRTSTSLNQRGRDSSAKRKNLWKLCHHNVYLRSSPKFNIKNNN